MPGVGTYQSPQPGHFFGLAGALLRGGKYVTAPPLAWQHSLKEQRERSP